MTMKTKTETCLCTLRPLLASIRTAATLALVAGCLAAESSTAAEAKVNPTREILSAAPAAELPARAADLVKTAKVRDRAAVTVQVVQTAVLLNPAAVCAVVAAISKAVPDMAAVTASAAAEAQPKQAAAIARAAATAAPAKTGKIVAAVCRVVPNQYKSVAVAVAEAVPAASHEILQAVASAVPALKTGIEAALANHRYSPLSVPDVLDSVKPSPTAGNNLPAVAATGPAATRPGAGTMLIPPATPPSADPPSPGPGPRGNRNYAVP